MLLFACQWVFHLLAWFVPWVKFGGNASECQKHVVELQIHLQRIYAHKTQEEIEPDDIDVDDEESLVRSEARHRRSSGHQRYTEFRTIMAR